MMGLFLEPEFSSCLPADDARFWLINPYIFERITQLAKREKI
jgi:hypothetical protein